MSGPEEQAQKRQKTEGEDAQLEPQLVEGMQELEGIQNKLDEVGWMGSGAWRVKARMRVRAHSQTGRLNARSLGDA